MFIQPRLNSTASNEQVEESGYMASASDLMIGLLFIFIVMVMVLLSRKPEQPPEPPADPLATVVHTIGTKLQNAGVPVTINQVSGVISLPADTLFARANRPSSCSKSCLATSIRSAASCRPTARPTPNRWRLKPF